MKILHTKDNIQSISSQKIIIWLNVKEQFYVWSWKTCKDSEELGKHCYFIQRNLFAIAKIRNHAVIKIGDLNYLDSAVST